MNDEHGGVSVNPSIKSLNLVDAAGEELSELKLEQEQEDDILRQATGCFYLEEATSLSLIVDTAETSISHLGAKLPALRELHLNGSALEGIRNLGTGFKVLSVLWVSRCSLTGLDGLGSVAPTLQELYASFNEIADLSPLAELETLEVLDLEGNNVSDVDQVSFLSMCPKLNSLNLALNPIAASEGYREAVLALLPGIRTLDDSPVNCGGGDSDARGADALSDIGSIGDLSTGLTPSDTEDEGGDAGGAGGARLAEAAADLKRELEEARREMEMIRDGIKYTAPLVARGEAGTGVDEDDVSEALIRPGTAYLGRAAGVARPRTGAGPASGGPSPNPSGLMPPPGPLGRPNTASMGRPGTASFSRPNSSQRPSTASSLGLYWRKNRITNSAEGGQPSGHPGDMGSGGAAGGGGAAGAAAADSGASELTRGGSALAGGVAKALRKRRGDADAPAVLSDVGPLDHRGLLDELRQFKARLDAQQQQAAHAAQNPTNWGFAGPGGWGDRPASQGSAAAAASASAERTSSGPQHSAGGARPGSRASASSRATSARSGGLDDYELSADEGTQSYFPAPPPGAILEGGGSSESSDNEAEDARGGSGPASSSVLHVPPPGAPTAVGIRGLLRRPSALAVERPAGAASPAAQGGAGLAAASLPPRPSPASASFGARSGGGMPGPAASTPGAPSSASGAPAAARTNTPPGGVSLSISDSRSPKPPSQPPVSGSGAGSPGLSFAPVGTGGLRRPPGGPQSASNSLSRGTGEGTPLANGGSFGNRPVSAVSTASSGGSGSRPGSAADGEHAAAGSDAGPHGQGHGVGGPGPASAAAKLSMPPPVSLPMLRRGAAGGLALDGFGSKGQAAGAAGTMRGAKAPSQGPVGLGMEGQGGGGGHGAQKSLVPPTRP